MKKKKKYERPEFEIVYSYDMESELMYGGTLGGGGGSTPTEGFLTGSGGNLSNPTDDNDDSDRAKGGFTWGNLWDDEF